MNGTWFVVPTPFADDGSLDGRSQRRVARGAISWGVDGLTVMGVTSEASALTAGERSSALGAIFEAAEGQVPVVVGCSGPSAEVVLERVEQARSLGAAAAMVSAPPFHRDPDGLPAFFARVAGDDGLPLLIQDEPAATGVVLPVSVLLRCLEASRSRTVKLEDPPTPPKIARLLEARPDLEVFGGLGGVSALAELRRGACGTMTGFAYPEILRAVRIAIEVGDVHEAGRVFDAYLPLIQLEAQPDVGLAIRKELLRRRGVLSSNRTRTASGLDRVTMDEIGEVLARVRITPGPEPLEVARESQPSRKEA